MNATSGDPDGIDPMLLEAVQTLIEVRVALQAECIAAGSEARTRLRSGLLSGLEATIERVRVHRLIPAGVNVIPYAGDVPPD